LRAKRPTKDEFAAEFRNIKASEKLSRRKELVRYMLQKWSESACRNPIDESRMTIEHLASQGRRGHALSDDVVAEIGNLAWVSLDVQKRLGTKAFESKRSVLIKNHCWVDEALSKHDGEWNKKAIRDRTDHLAKDAFEKVWKN
jgi:hypothetical protein